MFSCALLQVSSVFSPGNFQGFALVNRQRTNRISTGFTVEVSTEGTQLSYSSFDYGVQEPHYWQLPGVYQGDKVSIKEQALGLSRGSSPGKTVKPLLGMSGAYQKPVDHFFSHCLVLLQTSAKLSVQADCFCLLFSSHLGFVSSSLICVFATF